MVLRLNVPAIEAKPAISAETRPKDITALISGLPQSNFPEAARLLLDELAMLNRQRCSIAVRVAALELYRPAIFSMAHGLARQYCNQALPLQESAIAHARLAQQLFSELAIGYKQAILTEERRLFTIGDENQRALLMQRAMDALGRQLHVCYLTYSNNPAGIWSELHLLYLQSVQLGLQGLAVPDEAGAVSIDLTYKHALLLSIANPSQLNSLDIERVIEYLDHFASLAQLRPLGGIDKLVGIFLVRLQSDKPPIQLEKHTQNADPDTDILLVTVELARQVHQHIHQLKSNVRPISPDLPEVALLDQRYRDMLQHLLRYWGNPPKRGFQRAEKKNPIHMCMGLADLYSFLEQEGSTSAGAIAAGTAIDGGAPSLDKKSETWVVVNESPGGLALKKSSPAQGNLRIGELIGLKTDSVGPWGLAIVRRASLGELESLQIGVQMIAPSAKKVILHVIDSTQTEFALLLPELAALKQTDTLISTRGIYKPARTLRLEEDGKMTDIMLTKLVERTNNFERFQFSRL